MLRFAKGLVLCAMALFGGALLTAATDQATTCRIQYRYTQGNNADVRCHGACPVGNCDLVVWIQGPWVVYSCACPNDQWVECPGVVLQGSTGIIGACLVAYEPCGPLLRGECIGSSNPTPDYADTCVCVMP